MSLNEWLCVLTTKYSWVSITNITSHIWWVSFSCGFTSLENTSLEHMLICILNCNFLLDLHVGSSAALLRGGSVSFVIVFLISSYVGWHLANPLGTGLAYDLLWVSHQILGDSFALMSSLLALFNLCILYNNYSLYL